MSPAVAATKAIIFSVFILGLLKALSQNSTKTYLKLSHVMKISPQQKRCREEFLKVPLRVKATVCDNRRSAFDVTLTLLNPNICAHIADIHNIELSDYRTFRLSSSLQLDTVVMCVFIDESEST